MTTQPKDDALPDELFFEILRREKKFYELLLVAWSSVELDIDRLVTRQFNMKWDYQDKKVQFLVEPTFEKRLAFLKKIDVVSPEEFRVIHKFQNHRNEFFHRFGTARVENQGAEEVERTMDEAVAAAKLTYSIVRRELQGKEN